jgi:hypothetical protein
MLALSFFGFAMEFFAIEFLGSEVAEEDHDSIVSWVALHAEPDIERFRIISFEFTRLAEVHGASIVLYVRRVFVNDSGKALEEVVANERAALAYEFVGSAISEREVVIAIEKDDGVGSGVKELRHLPTELLGRRI